MQDIFEKLTKVDEEQEEDRYDPEKNLRSKIIDMFYNEDYAFVGEQQVASRTHLEFRKGDSTVKVII